MKDRLIFRGDIYYLDFGKFEGSVQGGFRHGIVVQNDLGNFYSDIVIVAAISSKVGKQHLKTHVFLSKKKYPFLDHDSYVMLEQIKTVPKSHLKIWMGSIQDDDIEKLDDAAIMSVTNKNVVGLEDFKKRIINSYLQNKDNIVE